MSEIEPPLHFKLFHYEDDGSYYVIEGVNLALVTEGETLPDVLHNLGEAIELWFVDEAREMMDYPPIHIEFQRDNRI